MKIKANMTKRMTKEIGKYSFEVGILKNEPKKMRKKGASKSFAGIKVSGTGKTSPATSLAKVAGYLDKRFRWLSKPFQKTNTKNKEIMRLVNEIANQVFGKKSIDNKRLENAVQAVVRNPILRGDYGSNATSTIKAKGFDKLGIDTAQLFKSIKAKRL